MGLGGDGLDGSEERDCLGLVGKEEHTRVGCGGMGLDDGAVEDAWAATGAGGSGRGGLWLVGSGGRRGC